MKKKLNFFNPYAQCFGHSLEFAKTLDYKAMLQVLVLFISLLRVY